MIESTIERLRAAGCIAAELEATDMVATAPDHRTLAAWVARREQGEPLEWILGVTTFCDLSLTIVPGTYVPRPQSEELARRAAALLPHDGLAVDLCTGIGAVGAHLKRAVPTATVLGVDIDPLAASCARRNGVMALVGDLATPLRKRHVVDVVTAVAPYVPTDAMTLLSADVQRYEPTTALDGGTDGLSLVRRVVGAGRDLVRPGGWLLVEIGGEQDETLSPTLREADFGDVVTWTDDHGDLRGLAARRN